MGSAMLRGQSGQKVSQRSCRSTLQLRALTLLAFPLMALGCSKSTPASTATPRAHISGISVGAATQVLAPPGGSPCGAVPACAGSSSINCYGGLESLADEHSTVLPPGTLPGHDHDYLFFVPAKTCLNDDQTKATGSTSGLVVLTSTGPEAGGVWALAYAADYGYYNETFSHQAVQGHGQIFLAPVDRSSCPATPDATFDLNYANPGSVVVDPTRSGGDKLLMVYEGTNDCVSYWTNGGTQDGNFYSTLGIATTTDYGLTWASYKTSHVNLPHQSLTAGPTQPLGVWGDMSKVCAGNDCSVATLPANYGRYAVIGAPVSLASLVAAGQPLVAKSTGAAEPSAFVDDVNTAQGTYLYAVHGAKSGPYTYPGMEQSGVTVSRAALGGSEPLKFMRWYGPAVAYGVSSVASFSLQTITAKGPNCGPGITSCQLTNKGHAADGGGLGSPLFPQDPANSAEAFSHCQAANQNQGSGSISYFEPTGQYLVIFTCGSPNPPNARTSPPPAPGTFWSSWFYATLDPANPDLSDQSGWSPPQEIQSSGAWRTDNGASSKCSYDGWYPTFMSLGAKAGHLTASGYAFSMSGCLDTGAGKPRAYVSRTLSIATSNPNQSP